MRALCLFVLIICGAAAYAAETATHTYDARGRLVSVSHSGGPNAGDTTSYTYDKADNRTAKTTTGPGAVNFTITNNGAVTEGGSSVFTVTKNGTASVSMSVNYATANGTAAQPGDYTSTSGTLAFTTTQTSKTVSVPTIDDATVESAETFSMALSAPTGGATLGTPSSATATINDNDVVANCTGVSYKIGDSIAIEGDALSFTVTKTGSTSSSCSVNFATANGTATAPTYYTATSGTLTFTAGQTSQVVQVFTNYIPRNSGTINLFVNLTSPTGGATITDSQGMGTITADGGCGAVC